MCFAGDIVSISFLGQLIFTVAAPTALRTTGPYFYTIFIGLTASCKFDVQPLNRNDGGSCAP